MEIAAQVTNFAFYHNTQTIYCTVEVLENRITDTSHKNINFFNTIKKGNKLNLKYIEDDVEEIIKILQNRILKFTIILVEQQQTRDKNQGPKYIFQKVTKCDILGEI